MALLDPAITDPLADHLADLRTINRRPSTIYQRERALLRLTAATGLPLLAMDSVTLRDHCSRDGLDVEARASEVSHARGFYRWAVREGLLDIDPSARLERPKRPRRLPRPMSDERARAAIANAESPIREWLFFAAYAGLRACEIAQLRGEDLLRHQLPAVLVIRESKGGDMTTVPMSSALVNAITALPSDGWCFPSGRGGKREHVSAAQLSKRANQYLHDLGIPDTFHSLRHWFGTNTYRATGRDLRATQELMRHKSPVPTAIYTFVDPTEGAQALDRLPCLVGT